MAMITVPTAAEKESRIGFRMVAELGRLNNQQRWHEGAESS